MRAGRALCVVSLHRWRRQHARGVPGPAWFSRCSRCGKERYVSDIQVPPVQ